MFKIRIRDHERGLWFRHGNFLRVLKPGVYRLWSRLWSASRDRVEVYNTLVFEFDHILLDVLVKHAEVRDELAIVELADNQRALVWKDDRLAEVLGPGRHAYWKAAHAVRVEVFDVNDFEFDHPRIEAVLGHRGAANFLEGLRVEAHERSLVYREGRLVRQFEPGMYVFWKQAGKITWVDVDLREQSLDVSGQEIMTRDKVTLRVNLLVKYRVVDAVIAVESVSDYAQSLYRDAQLALRAAVGSRNLDALLGDKEAVSDEVRDAIAIRAESMGLSVSGVGLRDIILPGEMKSILNQVIEAEKQAQANLIRRREETSAARSQANTAKLLAENPVLARMKELEVLQDILSNAKATFVLGQGAALDQVTGLIGNGSADGES